MPDTTDYSYLKCAASISLVSAVFAYFTGYETEPMKAVKSGVILAGGPYIVNTMYVEPYLNKKPGSG